MPNKKRKQAAKNEYVGLARGKNVCCCYNAYDRQLLTELINSNMNDDVLKRVAAEDEVKSLRNIFKTSDLSTIPLIIGATVLNKLDLINDLIRRGVNVNEPDQHRATALIWAIKHKNLEGVAMLLDAGADVTMQSPNGDHIVFTALDSKLWDEESFIFLWNRINEVATVDCNLLNKSGNSMMHIAVRREWFSFLDKLIEKGTDIDIVNNNGVTPLMLASYRNSLEMIDRFISKDADVERQDCNGFFPLCYAFSSAIAKHLRPPNSIANRLLRELQQKAFSWEDYIQKRMEMILNFTDLQQQHNGQPISIMLLYILAYIIRHTENGLKTLLNMNVFQKLKKVIWKCIDCPDRLRVMLILMHEILIYSEFCPEPKTLVLELAHAFETSGCIGACVEILRRYEVNRSCDWLLPFSFRILVHVGLTQGKTHEWFQNNLNDLQHFYSLIQNMELHNLDEKIAAHHNYKALLQNGILSQDKMAKFKELLNGRVQNSESAVICTKMAGTCEDDEHETCSIQETKSNSKKAKRRTKALKAKIAKIKSADLTERLNLNGKKILLQKRPEVEQVVEVTKSCSESEANVKPEEKPITEPPNQEEDCSIVNAIKRNLFIGNELDSEIYCESSEKQFTFSLSDWKSQILNLPFDSKLRKWYMYHEDFRFKPDELKIFTCSESSPTPKITEENVDEIIFPAIKYLKMLVNKIIDKYRKYWEIDEELEKECRKITKEKISDEEDNPEQNTILEKLEKEKIELLLAEFNNIVAYIKETAIKDMDQCRNLLKNAERILLSHEIRGSTIISEICPMETIYVSVTMPENLEIPNLNNAENALTNYMEDVLNNKREPIDSIKITVTEPKNKAKDNNYFSDDILYMTEMKALPKAKKVNPKVQLEAQRKTLKSAYHVQPLLSELFDDIEEDSSKQKEAADFDEYERMSKTMMFFNKTAFQSRSELELSDTFVDPLRKEEGDAETSRWCSLVRSLEMMEDCQEFLGGRVRISCKEKRQSHVISTGGNFTPVELGLDACNHSLAVKRIPKGSCVCEMIKTMLVELLNLRHKNLLHYFACEYDTNELIIATPLCEYNVGQYLMLMKQNQTSLTAVEVVKQFLTGLLFLHDRQEPIVHGNLKPSNIFVDINGVVKIAEFGIHRALFKFKEAPNSSIIWFATETYRTFKQLSTMECSSASDIQVAGMLVHFLMTAGKHPYGDDMRIILKNLDKAVPQLSANDLELEDLITWMLLYDPSERPNIQQVVTHVYFWSPERKWRFILTCAGLGSKSGNPTFKLDELHVCLEKVAFKDNIKGKWVQVVKQQFPKISFANNDDTPTGLLKFIRTCMDTKDPLCFHTDLNLSNYILTSFPAFALSLYRMLENSVWVKHSTFSSFYSVDNIYT